LLGKHQLNLSDQKTNLNNIGMDTSESIKISKLIEKVKELYYLDVTPGTDFLYKSYVEELNHELDLGKINYMEHYKIEDTIYIVVQIEYKQSSTDYYDGYIIKYNFSNKVVG
jgi:hypothetical protein